MQEQTIISVNQNSTVDYLNTVFFSGIITLVAIILIIKRIKK